MAVDFGSSVAEFSRSIGVQEYWVKTGTASCKTRLLRVQGSGFRFYKKEAIPFSRMSHESMSLLAGSGFRVIFSATFILTRHSLGEGDFSV